MATDVDCQPTSPSEWTKGTQMIHGALTSNISQEVDEHIIDLGNAGERRETEISGILASEPQDPKCVCRIAKVYFCRGSCAILEMRNKRSTRTKTEIL